MMGRGGLLILALLLCAVVSEPACPPGFAMKNNMCVDEDECLVDLDPDYPDVEGICGENAICNNTPGSFTCHCEDGYRDQTYKKIPTCKDINECAEQKDLCGAHATCQNAIPGYSCICDPGFVSTTGVERFNHGNNISCRDIDECKEEGVQCGPNASCVNTLGSYQCVCNVGFQLISDNSSSSECKDICVIDKTICGNGTCHHGASGHYCACYAGFTNYGNNKSRCIELNCEHFEDTVTETFPLVHNLLKQLKNSCMELTVSENPTSLKEDILESLLSGINQLLSGERFGDKRKVSTFLDLVEEALRLVGPFIETPGINRSSRYTDLKLLVHKESALPKGTKTLSSEHAKLDIQMETAAGHPSIYPGFATASLLTFSNLEKSADGFFGKMKPPEKHVFKMNSKVVTVTVSNRNTSHLKVPIRLTLNHLQKSNQTHTCVFWDSSEDAWSPRGCTNVESNLEYTICSCDHLSSFAVLMALYDMKDSHKFELQLISWVGLPLSLICLFLCILTFSMIRSIKSPRTTIHLHLCISLFIAHLTFLVGISHTQNRVGCAVVAGILHFFYLAAFCWMCLEGIQLFRMVVLVFNTNFKTLYMMAGGYGVPAVIVGISALTNPRGYGTERHCWLDLDIIWSFFGPACAIIIINIFFFLITVWKLAQKFSSLNPDLDNLQKIKAFTITAVAQLCVLGTMWIFGCFQFDEGTIAMSYLFTIFGSLQGVMLFIMHCLFSKQVREEYGSILSRCCAPQKKSYSEFSYSHTGKVNASKSSQDTGESHI